MTEISFNTVSNRFTAIFIVIPLCLMSASKSFHLVDLMFHIFGLFAQIPFQCTSECFSQNSQPLESFGTFYLIHVVGNRHLFRAATVFLSLTSPSVRVAFLAEVGLIRIINLLLLLIITEVCCIIFRPRISTTVTRYFSTAQQAQRKSPVMLAAAAAGRCYDGAHPVFYR